MSWGKGSAEGGGGGWGERSSRGRGGGGGRKGFRGGGSGTLNDMKACFVLDTRVGKRICIEIWAHPCCITFLASKSKGGYIYRPRISSKGPKTFSMYFLFCGRSTPGGGDGALRRPPPIPGQRAPSLENRHLRVLLHNGGRKQ